MEVLNYIAIISGLLVLALMIRCIVYQHRQNGHFDRRSGLEDKRKKKVERRANRDEDESVW